MTNEEAIKLATGLRTDFKCESETMVDFCNTIIQALEQTRWIPVSERLPEKSTWVLVTCKFPDGDIFFDIRLINEWTETWDEDEDFIGTVLAWMPLPQPYKGESEDAE